MVVSTAPITLITGANKGIGREIARQLGQAGHLVLLGARDLTLGRQAAQDLCADGADVRFIELDVTKAEQITAVAKLIRTEHGRLDVLVNNAGILVLGGDGPPTQASLDAVRRTFDVNFFGAFAVIQAMLPLLQESSSPRVVNVSSGVGSLHHQGDPDWEFAGKARGLGYAASKSALNMLTVQLAAELKDAGVNIKVNSADPGFTGTDLNNHRGYQRLEQGAAAAVALALLPGDGPTGTFASFTEKLHVEPW